MLAVWAADCAERTLSLFEARAARDRRPRDAIVGLRAFARGEVRIGKVRTLAAQAHAGVAHMAADARGVAAYAAKAAGLAAPRDPTLSPTRRSGSRATSRRSFGTSSDAYLLRSALRACSGR